MYKIWRFIWSRTFLFLVLAITQIAMFIGMFVYFSSIASIAYTVLVLISLLVVVLVFERENINPAYKMMWVLLVVAFPVPGAIFYLVFGKNSLSFKASQRFMEIERRAGAAMVQDDAVLDALLETTANAQRVATYLQRYASSPVYNHTYSRYFPMGEDFFPSFLQALRAAKRSVYMEYFILEEGYMWDTTLAILKQKAAEGVDVRLVYDSFGCIFTLPSDYDARLRAQGVPCWQFNPMRLSVHISDYKLLNHRDHRKICVIDDEIGFTGGLNFADEYINRKERFGVWKDTGLMLKGPGVYPLTVTFLKMWDYVTGSRTTYEDHMPHGDFETDGWVQPYADSPLDMENVSENAYFGTIHAAQRYVYIVTPYLIIDNEMVTALCLAAKSGVDVRIITPGVPDKRQVYYVTQSFYRVLLQAGVRIYEYTPGFVHAKMYVSDDRTAIVGSANMDYRSLYLHFENCVMFYGGTMVKSVKKDVREMFAISREITLDNVLRTPWYKVLCQLVLRFFAPLL